MGTSERVLGHFPVAISTSLAFEGLFGYHPETPQVIDPDKPLYLEYDKVCINISTLIRNAMGSFETEDRKGLTPTRVLDVVKTEINTIQSFVKEETNDKLDVWFYICKYPNLNVKYPRALLRELKTDNQLSEWNIEKHIIESLLNDEQYSFINKIDYMFPTEAQTKAVIITHTPLDLLNQYSFLRLALLESHTGKVKLRTHWYTKLRTLPKDVNNFPFNKFTLQMFGDGVMFSAMPLKLRRYVVDLAKKSRWTTTSTKEKIMSDVKHERDPVFEQLVTDLFK